MYLLGDIGNTETKICLVNFNQKIIKKVVLKTNSISRKTLNSKLKFFLKKSKKIDKILFSSVVPPIFKLIKFYFLKNFKKQCFELKKMKIKKIIKIIVNKKQIGSDRLANAISVINNKDNFIIVDFGTATTFDVIIKNQYLGGVIAPGVDLSLKTLSSKASLIPYINLSKISKVIGNNTISAVRSGFFWGYSGLINNLIKLIIKQTKKSYKIVLTGGLSYLFKNSVRGKKIIIKDLTIYGLYKVLKKIK